MHPPTGFCFAVRSTTKHAAMISFFKDASTLCWTRAHGFRSKRTHSSALDCRASRMDFREYFFLLVVKY